MVPTGASVTHRSPAYALGLTRCACPGQRPAPPLRASPGGPTPRLLQSPFARPKQPKPGTLWNSAQLLPYNLRSATLARCATGHDRPESPVTIAGIRSKQVELSTRVKPWWFPAASGKLVLALRYGAKSIEIVKGKNAIEVTGMDDLIATLEIIKDAVQAGELDAQIEQASGALRAGFAKKKK